jgi:hypothetical protein
MIKGKYVIKSDGKIIAEKENLITNNGFYMINRYLAKSSIDWAGALTIGALPISPASTDKTLYYEIDRMPINLKSYAKMSPRFIILNKQLTSNVGYLNFKSITYPLLSSGYKIQVTGIDSTFNGTYNINSIQPLQAIITNVSASTGTVTYTATNSFTVGETVVITGVNPSAYNITGVVATASGSQFTITNAAIGSYVSGGTATQSYGYQVQFSKTALDVSSTAVSSNTALLTVLTDNSGNALFNNEIIVKATLDPALSARISEVGVLPINLKQNNNSSTRNLTGFSEKSIVNSSLSAWSSAASNSQVNLLGQTNINGSVLSQQSGYTWLSGTANVTLNVNNTSGLKVGSSVYITGATAATGSTVVPSGTGTVFQINGNYQVVVTMGSTNSSGSTQYGYGGTLSLNSSTLMNPSVYGQFNIALNSSDTVSITNVSIDTTGYSSSDSLLLLYYSTSAANNTAITINLTDNNNSSSPFVCVGTGIVTNIGLNVARIPLPSNYPSSGITTNSMSIKLVSGPSTIYLDSLKIVTNDYWTGHPYAGTLSITAVTPSSPSAGYVTYTTSGSHNFSIGNQVVISGVTPSGYSGTFNIYSIPTKYTFVVANSTTGTATIGSPSQAVSPTVIIMPAEYQLTSRSLFTTPIIKNSGQQMDIEYHLQVT